MTRPLDDVQSTLLPLIQRADEGAALVDPARDDAVIYAQLHEVVARLATELAGLGIGAGRCVMTILPVC